MEKRETSLRLSSQQKLIPRDISESLGKLPPQACDMEEAVLGVCMLEVKDSPHSKSAWSRVPFLKPDHFYDERHAEVFRAILQVVKDGSLPDMRMVVAKLREVGKIELVGGAHFLAGLTDRVSSGANLEANARVIVEHAMKRRLIEISSQIHQQAYEDTTDVFDLLQKTQEDIKFLEERETANSGPERIKALWEKYQIVVKPERPETLIKFGDADVCTVGNLSLLVGKKKARKSLLVTYMQHIFLQSRLNIADDLVVFDTEQEEYDVWQARDRVFRMTNQHVAFYCLRGLDPKQRRDFIEQTILHWPRPLKIAVIDGIRDCMSNINDPDESTMVMSWLMRLNVETKVHIINILHLNKTDNNARGHIGTELLNKAEVTIEVELDPHSKDLFPPSVVKCESSRRKPFEPFMFTHGATGLPEIIGAPIGKQAVNQDEQLKRLEMVFEGDCLRNKEVRQAISAQFSVGDNKARKLLADFIRMNWIVKSGPDRSPNTVYKLAVLAPSVKQQELNLNTVITVNTPPPVDQPASTSDELPF